MVSHREKIEQMVCSIMYHDGPDQHTDGSDVITSLIFALLEGKFYELQSQYDMLNKMEYSDIVESRGYYKFKESFHKETLPEQSQAQKICDVLNEYLTDQDRKSLATFVKLLEGIGGSK
jgi:hypothetical protein